MKNKIMCGWYKCKNEAHFVRWDKNERVNLCREHMADGINSDLEWNREKGSYPKRKMEYYRLLKNGEWKAITPKQFFAIANKQWNAEHTQKLKKAGKTESLIKLPISPKMLSDTVKSQNRKVFKGWNTSLYSPFTQK